MQRDCSDKKRALETKHSSHTNAPSLLQETSNQRPSSALRNPPKAANMSDQSYENIPLAASPSPSSDELDSLPSTSASTTSMSPSEEEWQSDAEREWKESLQQLELLLTMVLVPYLGKYFGRKAAYWGWTKYMEWKYPVHIEVTNPGLFKGIGAVEAAASL